MTQYSSTLKTPRFHNSRGVRMPNDTGWQTRHEQALHMPKGPEIAIVGLLDAWARYADQHSERFESGIGEDSVLGPAWAAIGASIRRLLNGESGRLDCGTLDAFLCNTLEAEGFNPDML